MSIQGFGIIIDPSMNPSLGLGREMFIPQHKHGELMICAEEEYPYIAMATGSHKQQTLWITVMNFNVKLLHPAILYGLP